MKKLKYSGQGEYMSALIIAIANQKGGVGKTTVATQLAYNLVLKQNKKVLYVDMDAQGNGSSVLLGGEDITGTEATSLFDPECEEFIPTPTHYGIDLLATPCNSRLSYDLEGLPEEYVTMPAQKIRSLVDDYDVILVDCPPNLGLKLRASLTMATHVLCPLRLCGFAVEGLAGLLETIQSIQNTTNPNLMLVGALINAFDRSIAHQQTLEVIQEEMQGVILENIIRHRSPFDRANSEGIPVWEVPSAYRAANEIALAFDEIYAKLNLK